MMIDILLSKPFLIGFHLGFAIVGIDAFFWFFGELISGAYHRVRARSAALVGLLGFIFSWIAGGYYYVVYYGTLVKPTIQKGLAPWAHAIFMEAKEHIFLFLVPVGATIFLATFLPEEVLQSRYVKRYLKLLTISVIIVGLIIGAMGFIISAAARWGVK